jgi:two-component system, NtrC family, response regulator HydG
MKEAPLQVPSHCGEDYLRLPLAGPCQSCLRVLQSGEIKRVRGNFTIKVDVRIIAATNRNLEQEVQQGRFREDLFFRLNTVEIELPPLAGRRDDIPALAMHFIKKHSDIRNRSGLPEVVGLTREVHRLFDRYPWPGNVRELEHVIERALSLGASKYVQVEDLPNRLRPEKTEAVVQCGPESIRPYDVEFEEFQKTLFERTLQKTNGKRREVALGLGLNLKYFYRICRQLGIKY